MKCSHCSAEIEEVYYTEERNGWVELKETDEEGITEIDNYGDNIDVKITFYCPECDEDVTSQIKI